MNDPKDSAGENQSSYYPDSGSGPYDPERAAARHGRRKRNVPESPRGAFQGDRFGGQAGRSQRGYRGESPYDTPPGSVPGGSYGGGGGYSQDGYEQGNFDPAVDRHRQSRGSGQPESGGGDWRRDYGRYGMSERGRQPGPERHHEADMHGNASEDEPAGGYGLGHVRGGHGQWQRGPAEGSEGGWGVPEMPRPTQHPGLGHASRDEQWTVPGRYTGRGPENWERPAEAIRNDVCERLTRHGEVDASGIRVHVENGEVILEGRVDSRSAKRMAEDTAETVTGVRDVQNRLRIDYRDEH
jgi:hypothetical protein